MTAASAHRWLRDGCAAAHARVDTQFSRFDLQQPASYGRFLAAHAAAVLPLEAALEAPMTALLPDWPGRQRGSALRRDLAQLQLIEPPALVAPALPTAAAAWGAAYVLEGSRLGATVLARRLAPGLPVQYLSADSTPAQWPRFLAALEIALVSPPAREEALATALASFALFERAASYRLHPLPSE